MRNIKAKYLLILVVILSVIILSTSCSLPRIEFVPPPGTSTPNVPATPPAQQNQEIPPPPVTPINPTWTPPPTTTATSESPALPDFVAVIAKVKPSVVAINTKVAVQNFFFGTSVQEGAGSGWIISSDGYIVTNNHVVEGAQSIEVALDDKRTFTATNIRTDPLTDLAVLKIDTQNLTALRIGDSSKLQVGEWVTAIGNSMGLGIRATKGIISALGATVPISQDQTLTDLIQTDAAINPGNSGGPLVNMKGEVVGINSVKIAEVGVEGMGYSISIKTAMPVIEALIKVGYVVRPWLGVGLYTADRSLAQRYNLPVEKGVIVTNVVVGSPAEKAGLKVMDVITVFNGQEVKDVSELQKAIHSTKIGSSVDITYWRTNNTQSNTTSVVVAESPPPK